MFYKVNSTTNIIEDVFTPLLEEIRCKRTTMDRTIIFCRSYASCTYMYHFFRSRLGREMSEPQGYLNYCELRLVDMFIACTHPDVKNILIITTVMSYSYIMHLIFLHLCCHPLLESIIRQVPGHVHLELWISVMLTAWNVGEYLSIRMDLRQYFIHIHCN